MKNRRFGLLLVFAASAGAGAQEIGSQRGLEMGLTYREGDPFLFCEPWSGGQGWKKAPQQCWVPLDPIRGTYTMMAWCRPPNTYGKDWTQDDYRSLAQYQSICPRAITRGTYDSGNPAYYDRRPVDR